MSFAALRSIASRFRVCRDRSQRTGGSAGEPVGKTRGASGARAVDGTTPSKEEDVERLRARVLNPARGLDALARRGAETKTYELELDDDDDADAERRDRKHKKEKSRKKDRRDRKERKDRKRSRRERSSRRNDSNSSSS